MPSQGKIMTRMESLPQTRHCAGLFNLAWRAPATLFTPPRQFRPLAHSGWVVTGARATPIVEMP